MPRPLNKIAAEILADFGPPTKNPPAFKVYSDPYLQAMLSLQSIDDTYGLDTAEDIVLRLTINLSGWRGETAKRIKNELNQPLKDFHANPTRQ